MSLRVLPPRISAFDEDTFASFTLQKRLPRILADVREQFAAAGQADPRWCALENAAVSGDVIDVSMLRPTTCFWMDRTCTLHGHRWAEQPFFDLEFLFYLAINSIAQDLRPGFDVFSAARHAALAAAFPHVARTVESLGILQLNDALRLAVSGNERDLSQLTNHNRALANMPMLADETAALAHRLSTQAGVVQILADNAGDELCYDLVLADVLLSFPVQAVELQLKAQPVFVSDALIVDVEETIALFERNGSLGKIAHLGARLREAVRDGRLKLSAPDDWIEPRHMNMLQADVSAALRTANVVLVKGDLNYRRFFEDRAWSVDTPVSEASVATGMCAFALRVLKSDCVVGVARSEAARLFATEPTWRSAAKYALIQRIDAHRQEV